MVVIKYLLAFILLLSSVCAVCADSRYVGEGTDYAWMIRYWPVEVAITYQAPYDITWWEEGTPMSCYWKNVFGGETLVHNHPVTQAGERTWLSKKDINTAITLSGQGYQPGMMIASCPKGYAYIVPPYYDGMLQQWVDWSEYRNLVNITINNATDPISSNYK